MKVAHYKSIDLRKGLRKKMTQKKYNKRIIHGLARDSNWKYGGGTPIYHQVVITESKP